MYINYKRIIDKATQKLYSSKKDWLYYNRLIFWGVYDGIY